MPSRSHSGSSRSRADDPLLAFCGSVGARRQPAHLPVLYYNERWLLATLSLSTYPLATHGPVDLVAVSLDGKTQAPLTRTGDLGGRLRLAADSIWLEGGAELIRLPLTGR